MMRSLWTGASGMKAQQTSVDTIANNLANVNTTGFKSQSTQFKSLLYQELQERTTTANGNPKPTNAQVGLGARVASINTSYTQGAQLASANNMACCINGSGFFAVSGEDGGTYYTRNGDFNWSLNNAGGLILTNAQGNPVLDRNGQWIELPASRLEKYLSMMLVCLVIAPLAFFCIYLLGDAIICLIDKQCGISIVAGWFSGKSRTSSNRSI